jgi:hypothetical protein
MIFLLVRPEDAGGSTNTVRHNFMYSPNTGILLILHTAHETVWVCQSCFESAHYSSRNNINERAYTRGNQNIDFALVIDHKNTRPSGTFPSPSPQTFLMFNLKFDTHYRCSDVPPELRGGMLSQIMTTEERENAESKRTIDPGDEETQSNVDEKEVETLGVREFEQYAGK